MKILVSGGAGFIGSHLVDQLVSQHHDVMVVDLVEPMAETGASRESPSRKRGSARTVLHDITQPLPSTVRRFRPDQIYNMACSSSPIQRHRDPIHATMTSVVGARNLLDLARENGARYLQGSSGSVYGDPAVHPQPESYLGNVNANGPRAPHDEAKRCAESLCLAYLQQHAVDTRIARIFSTYGPRMNADSGRLISTFVTHALRGEALTIHGDGTQSRSFCYVDDIVRGLELLMASDVEGPVNLGNSEEHTLLQLAERVLRMTGSQSRLRYVQPGVDDAHRRRPDISLAEQRLGWRPRIALQQGLQLTVAYFRDHLPAATIPKFSSMQISVSPATAGPGTDTTVLT